MAKYAKKQIAAALAQLAAIVAAGENGCMQPESVYGPLHAEGLVEVNTAGAVDGNAPTRATPAGIAKAAEGQAPAAAPAAKPQFQLDSGIALPAIVGRGRTATTYPFDEMTVGQSFFVAATADKPTPAKSLASTVSSATARYAVEVPGETVVNRKGKTVPKMNEQRKFVVRAVEENGVKGARIWRTK